MSRKQGSPKGAIVYWIEKGSAELRSVVLTPDDIPGSRNYESEVLIKYAVDPVEIVPIQLARAGNDWERNEVARLKALAAELRAQRSD